MKYKTPTKVRITELTGKLLYLILYIITSSLFQFSIVISNKTDTLTFPGILGVFLLFIVTFPINQISIFIVVILYPIIYLINNMVFIYIFTDFSKLFDLMDTNLLLTVLFISGYYQWFIWFPKYLKKKKFSSKSSNKNNIKKVKNYGEKVVMKAKNKQEIKEETIKKIKSLIIAGYNDKQILNKIEGITKNEIGEIRNNLFKK